MSYYLPSTVHYCEVDDGVVFLDMQQGKYFGIGSAEATVFRALIRGATASASDDVATVASTLLQKGLLTNDPALAAAHGPARVEQLAEVDIGNPAAAAPPIRVLDVWNIVISAVVAALKLRWFSFRRIVRGVELRKQRRSSGLSSIDDERLKMVVRIFARVRTLIYTSRNRCLYDSLVLVEFLHRYRLYPTWVVAIHTRPFGAHSWVQYRDLALNERPDVAREYTPILAI